MKTRLLLIIVIAIAVSMPTLWYEQSFALCIEDVNYDSVLKESELVFTGTVTRLDNYDGPQKVTFFIHDVIKGEINTPKYILENSGMIFLENDTIMSSSTNVDYKIGKAYKVYVENGHTNQCTTKITTPPAGYVWEPGPEDGNYYSDKEDIPLQQYQDANEIKSYRDALTSGSVVLLAESPKLSDRELDDVMDELTNSEFDHFVLPIASIAIDYQRDTLVLWTPDLTIGNKVQAIIGDVSFVLLYQEAPVRWTHDGPIPEPDQDIPIPQNCGPGTILEDGICVVNSENEPIDSGVKWGGDTFNENLPPPNLQPIRDYDFELIYVIVLLTVIIIGGIVGGIVFVIRRKRK